MGDESSRTVAVALAANVCVAATKLVAAVLTGSTALLAEATHAVADVGNQLLLLVAQRRSRRPGDERHPFGYGREAYFWALIASVGVFVAGAAFSLREGISELMNPVAGASFVAVYVVLGVCLLADAVSLRQSSRQLRSEADSLHRDFLDQVDLTSDPTVRAVFVEDATAIAGDLIALAGIALHQVIGSSVPEGVAAVLIGVLLVAVGVQLARRNHDFLLGEQAQPAAKERVRAYLLSVPGVLAVRELLVTFTGPRQVWVLARVDVEDSLRGGDVERLVRDLESGLEGRSRYITRVDVVPIGGEGPVGSSPP